MKIWVLTAVMVVVFATGAVAKEMPIPIPKPATKPINQSCRTSKEISGSGAASWYGAELHGQKMADGTRFNMLALTAAHRTLPFGTRVQVKNKRNGKMIVVKIADRGPYAKGRIIDVSKEAARKLGFVTRGTANVEIRKCLSKAAYEKEQKQELKVKPKKPVKTNR